MKDFFEFYSSNPKSVSIIWFGIFVVIGCLIYPKIKNSPKRPRNKKEERFFCFVYSYLLFIVSVILSGVVTYLGPALLIMALMVGLIYLFSSSIDKIFK